MDLPSSERVRANPVIRLVMEYVLPSCTIVMLSVGVRKVGARTEVYIVAGTVPAVLLLGEAGWIPSISSDWKHRHKSLIIDHQLPGCQPVYARR